MHKFQYVSLQQGNNLFHILLFDKITTTKQDQQPKASDRITPRALLLIRLPVLRTFTLATLATATATAVVSHLFVLYIKFENKMYIYINL